MDWADEAQDEILDAYFETAQVNPSEFYDLSYLGKLIANRLRAERAASDKQAETLRTTCGNLRILVLAKDKRIAELEAQIARMREAGNELVECLNARGGCDCITAWRAAEKGT